MKIWIDDIRPAPDGYEREVSVEGAQLTIEYLESIFKPIELIDIDHDAGKYANKGGDYIKLLDWLEATGRNYPIRIHSQNPVGVENMRRIIRKNHWIEVV